MWVGMRRLSPCLHMHSCPLFFSRLLARRRKMAPRTISSKKGECSLLIHDAQAKTHTRNQEGVARAKGTTYVIPLDRDQDRS